jgi:hypothetical protein
MPVGKRGRTLLSVASRRGAPHLAAQSPRSTPGCLLPCEASLLSVRDEVTPPLDLSQDSIALHELRES